MWVSTMMDKHIKSLGSVMLLGLGLLVGCAGAPTEGDNSQTTGLTRSTLDDGQAGIETSSGVTDISSALEYAGGSTDEAVQTQAIPRRSSSATSATATSSATVKRTCTQGSAVSCTPSSTGAGVQHGSPQPLDPKPVDTSSTATK